MSMSILAVPQPASLRSTAAADRGPWLLEVRAHKGKVVGWFALAAVSTPIVLAMAAALAALLVWSIVQLIGRGSIAGVITFALVLLPVIGSILVACCWIMIRMTVGLWRCLRHGRAAVRADALGLELFNPFKGRWERLAWAEVGTIGVPQTHTLVVEHMQPQAWLAAQSVWVRRVKRLAHRQLGVVPALQFDLPMEEPTREVALKIAALRDAVQTGGSVAPAQGTAV